MYAKAAKRAAAKSLGEVVLIGCEGAGKTLLCRHLEKLSKGDTSALSPSTQPSIGVETAELSCRSQAFSMREVGGVMQPVWGNYFAACAAVILVADSATAQGAASAAIELCEVLRAQTLAGKRVLLLLNKRDLPSAIPEPSVRLLLGLPALEDFAGPNRLRVLAVSALSGKGLTEVFEWCLESCLAHRQALKDAAMLEAAAAKEAAAAEKAAAKKAREKPPADGMPPPDRPRTLPKTSRWRKVRGLVAATSAIS